VNTLSASRFMLSLGCLAFVLAALPSQAQTRPAPGVRAVSPKAAPSPGFGLPGPSGLSSQVGQPSASPRPSGLSSGATTTSGNPRVVFVGPSDADVLPPQTNVMGAAGASYGAVTAGGRPATGMLGGPFTPLQVAQSFLGADLNHDGELTRAEAQRLSILPYGFEEMDRNHDGVVTRFEYEDAVRGLS